jgi:adenylosuccinate lyase
MYCVREKGGDRQVLHEAIRQHSVQAAQQVKQFGKKNDLLDRILGDKTFPLTAEELATLTDPATFTGMASLQTARFLEEQVRPVLNVNQASLGCDAVVRV